MTDHATKIAEEIIEALDNRCKMQGFDPKPDYQKLRISDACSIIAPLVEAGEDLRHHRRADAAERWDAALSASGDQEKSDG